MSQQSAAPQDAPAAPDPLIEAMLAQARASLKWELSDDEVAQVRTRIEGSMKLAAKLRDFPLANADEPDFMFRPYRSEG